VSLLRSHQALYSRGFASVYGEWETTAEAKSMNRTFPESLRFPAVDKPARVALLHDDACFGAGANGTARRGHGWRSWPKPSS